MSTVTLPSRATMLEAFLQRDSSFDGIFVTAVRTTGIFCRPTCTAKKPRPENVEFFASPKEALLSGYRPCKRCAPMRTPGEVPEWLSPLLEEVEADLSRRWRDRDLRALGLSPSRVRRWFGSHHGMTFHAYARARRLSEALGRIREGDEVTGAAFDHGYELLSAFHQAFKNLLGTSPTRAREGPVVTVARVPSPLGVMIGCATERALCLLEFTDRRMLETQLKRLRGPFVPGTNPILAQASDELASYFAGERREFTVPIEPQGTPFQQEVWRGLLRIPYGSTTSYGALARDLDRPSAVRAVARANGANPLAILVPCHRVVGSDGSLTGYGGGLWRKKRLLELEGARG